MKKVYISKAEKIESMFDHMSMNKKGYAEGMDLVVSDGYHTFDELYAHRVALFISLCKAFVEKGSATDGAKVWRSKKHSDGSAYEGWFIMGIDTVPGEQITYHLPMSEWDRTEFVFNTRETAPQFDGHTADDVLKRLKNL